MDNGVSKVMRTAILSVWVRKYAPAARASPAPIHSNQGSFAGFDFTVGVISKKVRTSIKDRNVMVSDRTSVRENPAA